MKTLPSSPPPNRYQLKNRVNDVKTINVAFFKDVLSNSNEITPVLRIKFIRYLTFLDEENMGKL